jgi:hypothetical protein
MKETDERRMRESRDWRLWKKEEKEKEERDKKEKEKELKEKEDVREANIADRESSFAPVAIPLHRGSQYTEVNMPDIPNTAGTEVDPESSMNSDSD